MSELETVAVVPPHRGRVEVVFRAHQYPGTLGEGAGYKSCPLVHRFGQCYPELTRKMAVRSDWTRSLPCLPLHRRSLTASVACDAAGLLGELDAVAQVASVVFSVDSSNKKYRCSTQPRLLPLLLRSSLQR